MQHLRYTDHARIMQQRAIPEAVVEALIAVGKAQHDHHGAVLYYFSKTRRKAVSPNLKHILERGRRVYVVVAEDSVVVTVGHRTKRIPR